MMSATHLDDMDAVISSETSYVVSHQNIEVSLYVWVSSSHRIFGLLGQN